VSTQATEKLKFTIILDRLRRYARSSLGLERIQACRPSASLSQIRMDHKLLNEMKRLLTADDPIPLDDIHDVRQDLHRSAIEGTVLSGLQILHIGRTLKASGAVRTYFDKRGGRYPHLSERSGGLCADKVLEHHIYSAINDDGEVKDSASGELQKIRRAIRDVSETLRKRMDRILQSLAREGMAQEELITTREGRMVVPVKAEYKHQVPGFIHSSSASGATVFVEPAETLEINNEIREYQISEQREINRILKSLTDAVAARKDVLLHAVDTLAEFDFLHAKAQYSIEIIGTSPRENAENVIRLVDARHPVLLLHHKRDEVVPLTLTLGDRYTTLIITGPNAGGKSVAMQTVGLMCLMYQSGLHIPASEESELPVFDNIYVAMGDEQSVEQDLSTFSSHVQTLKKIVAEAGSTSLVLIDEIGAGTDPVEGSALAASILNHLSAGGIRTIATTHHGDLKAFAYREPAVENGAMEFDQTTLSPTYRFTPGIPGSSYALEIAQRMDFPPELIVRARTYLGSAKSSVEQLLIDLERQGQRYRRELADISAEKDRLERTSSIYKEKMNTLNAEIRELKRTAAEEAKRIVARANTMIEQAVREIRESSADSAVAQRWRKQADDLHREMETQSRELQSPRQTASDTSPLWPGDRVVMEGSEQEGEVISSADNDGYVQVVFGAVKMRVHRKKLEKRQSGDSPRSAAKPGTMMSADTGGSTANEWTAWPRTLDVRGYSGDEAVAAVDVFLDRAVLAGYREVEIVHGKGTGALRKRIGEFLKSHAAVVSHRLGNWNEGGMGVTVAEIRQEAS
jgi:DNA mismatch repair protein MutS2